MPAKRFSKLAMLSGAFDTHAATGPDSRKARPEMPLSKRMTIRKAASNLGK
jgi:hypothetical protein